MKGLRIKLPAAWIPVGVSWHRPAGLGPGSPRGAYRRRPTVAGRPVTWLLGGVVALLACVHASPRVPEPVAPLVVEAAPSPQPAADVAVAEPVDAVEVVEAPALPPPPLAPPPRALPTTVRIGLATDLDEVRLSCCHVELEAAGAEPELLLTAVMVTPAAPPVRPASYRLQVAALKDERQAQGMAARLRERLGEPADVVFDAGIDLYRVRVGNYADRAEAEVTQRRLAALGLSQAWVVSEAAELPNAALRVIQGGSVRTVPGRRLSFVAPPDEGIRVAGGRYRGRVIVYLNDRGSLNLINELPIEEYLRGVVPREMGPAIYDSLEALKAQTVAARTYTLKNMGEFAAEGYDLCATPRCQVYGGMDVEHALTDRAIGETAGVVVVSDGELVDALYSSTCGGHTEDVNVVFPLKHEPYLKGVPCVEAGVDRIPNAVPADGGFPAALSRRIAPPAGAVGDPAGLAARLQHLTLLAGLETRPGRLRSLQRLEVQRYLAELLDLGLDVRLFVAGEDLPYVLFNSPHDWSHEDLRLAAFLSKSGLLSGPLDEPLGEAEIERLVLSLAQMLHIVEVVEGRYLGFDGETVRVRARDEDRAVVPAERMLAFRRGPADTVPAPLALLPGDAVTFYVRDDEAIAAVHDADMDGASFDRTSSLSSWNRFRGDRQLAARVAERYPGFVYRGFEILERGVSGRVGRLRLSGADGETLDVEGLAVRWTLDLPDTLFTARRLRPSGREAGWLFSGRGWGHGVGMCQVGAYGMGLRGHSYVEILEHYYSGVEVGVWNALTRTAALASN